MKNVLIGICLFVLIFGLMPELKAQAIDVRGGDQTLNITTGLAGSEPIAVVNTLTTIKYWRQSKVSKITVRTVCSGQSFTLLVLATGVSQGVAAPEVNLLNGMLDANLITNIPNSGFGNITITLQYTASATFAQGNSAEQGNDVHTVLYTILAQ